MSDPTQAPAIEETPPDYEGTPAAHFGNITVGLGGETFNVAHWLRELIGKRGTRKGVRDAEQAVERAEQLEARVEELEAELAQLGKDAVLKSSFDGAPGELGTVRAKLITEDEFAALENRVEAANEALTQANARLADLQVWRDGLAPPDPSALPALENRVETVEMAVTAPPPAKPSETPGKDAPATTSRGKKS